MKQIDIFKILFTSLPVPIQNAFITYKGFTEFRRRYAGGDTIDCAEGRDRADLVREQTSRLQALLKHASRYVPFYVDYFRKHNINYENITPGNISKHLPCITKDYLLTNQEQFYSTSHKRLGTIFTSGTTGSPLQVKYTPAARRKNYAFYEMILRKYDCQYRSKSVTFAGRDFLPKKPNGVYWRHDRYNNTLYMSSYHISNDSLPLYFRKIYDWCPEFIDSYPSAITQIAKYILSEHKTVRRPPKVILTSAESLKDEDKALIERAFKTQIVDQYGCTEMCAMAYSTCAGYYFDPRYSIIEFEETSEPHLKSIICTGLINEGMPLIRYKIGDLAELYPGDNFYNDFLVKRIVGRTDDLISTPDGRKIGRMDPVFKGVGGIARAQVAQQSIDIIYIYIEELKPGSFTTRDREILYNNTVARLGDSVRIDILVVNSIPLTSNGKFRPVISKVS